MADSKLKIDFPVTKEVQDFVEFTFPCTEPPCGACQYCEEKAVFLDGYNHGCHAMIEMLQANENDKLYSVLTIDALNRQVEDLKMICRRLAAAKTIEKRDAVVALCLHLFKGQITR